MWMSGSGTLRGPMSLMNAPPMSRQTASVASVSAIPARRAGPRSHRRTWRRNEHTHGNTGAGADGGVPGVAAVRAVAVPRRGAGVAGRVAGDVPGVAVVAVWVRRVGGTMIRRFCRGCCWRS